MLWVPPEVKDPILWDPLTRKQVGMYGAVLLKEGQLLTRQSL